MDSSATPSDGFTLIELSIVLVIIALIIGGVMVGQDMVKAAQIRSQITQINDFKAAVQTFRTKYNCIPGDCPNATDFFGSVASCYSGQSDGVLTCNGDGNGTLGFNSAAAAPYQYEEEYHFWVQLSAAGLISNKYVGVTFSTNRGSKPGWNIPLSKMNGGGVDADYYGSKSGAGGYFNGFYGHVFQLGAVPSAFTDMARRPLLTTSEALQIDLKADDGLPGTGVVMSYTPAFVYTPNCVTSATAATAQYDLTQTGAQCVAFFLNVF